MHISLLFKALDTRDSHYSNRSALPAYTHAHTQFSPQKTGRPSHGNTEGQAGAGYRALGKLIQTKMSLLIAGKLD